MNKALLLKALDTFEKQTSADWRRYHRIADRAAPKVFKAFNQAVARLQLSVSVPSARKWLEVNNATNAILVADWDQFQQDIIDFPLTKPFLEGADMAVDEIIRNKELREVALENINKATAELEIKTAFNIRNTNAELFLIQNQNFLANSIAVESQAAVRDVVLRGFQTGKPPAVMAREIKDLVGLTKVQANAIVNLRADLNAQMIAGKSPFKTIALTPNKIDEVVARRTKRMIRQRAQTIARTETIRAANAGQVAVWESAVAEGLLPSTVRKIWQSALDERTCPFCNSLHGTTVELRETFSVSVENQSGGVVTINEPHPPAHVLCRCSVSIEIDETPSVSNRGSNLFVNAVTAAQIRAGNVEEAELFD